MDFFSGKFPESTVKFKVNKKSIAKNAHPAASAFSKFSSTNYIHPVYSLLCIIFLAMR